MSLVELMDGIPTVDLSPGAAAASAPHEAVTSSACEAMDQLGCVRLIHAFPPEQMLELRRESDRRHAHYFAEDHYADARGQGDRRTLITLELAGGFGVPSFYANERVYAIAAKVLGEGFILGHIAVILSRPGSKDQFVHRDTPSLFKDSQYDAFMPAVGVALVLPLVALDGVNGGTQVWPGTHRVASDEVARAMPSTVAELPLGSCLMFNVRLMHGGKGNRSNDMRSIVYGAYHRKWFRDWDGFENQPPIDMSRRTLSQVPPELRHLFEWRFDRHAGWRRRDLMERALSYVPAGVADGVRRALGRS